MGGEYEWWVWVVSMGGSMGGGKRLEKWVEKEG